MPFNFGGQTYVSPTVVSSVNDNALVPVAAPNGNGLLLIGQSADGAPNTVLTFASPTALQAALGSGDLVDAGLRAFNPSPDVAGPGQVSVIRVNPAVAATLAIKNGAAATLGTLTSTSYGQRANLASVSIAAGSVQGFALTVNFAGKTAFRDNVYQSAFTLTYTGAGATPTITITSTSLVLQVAGAAVATIPFANFPTVAQVVSVINSTAGFTAVQSAGAANLAASGMDAVTAGALTGTPVVITATLQAVTAWFNATGIVTFAPVASPVGLPAALPTTYLTGGSDGTITNTQWANALTAAQGLDVQWLVALSTSATVHAMVSAHCAFMSSQGRSERRAFASGALGSTDAQAIAAASALNSDRVAYVHLGIYDYDLTGALAGLVLYSPYIHAAMIAGGFAGAGPGVAMTNKSLNIQGVERPLQNPTATDPLILGGVLCTAPDGAQFKVVRSVSTWLDTAKFNRVEVSCGAALDYTVRALRLAVKPYLGEPGSPGTMAKQLSAAETALRKLSTAKPNGPGVLVGDANSPPWTNLSISLSGDNTVVSVQASPVIPLNYEGIAVYAVPYSGTVTASSAT
jgi:hypothetical protein